MDAFLGVLTTRHPMFKTSEHVAALVSLRFQMLVMRCQSCLVFVSVC